MALSKVRKAVVAGKFYPQYAKDINKEIDAFLEDNKGPKLEAIGCVLPHAGYIYSGKVAAVTLAQIDIPDRIILLGPNHTGNGAAYSIMTDGLWETPLGQVGIDRELAQLILRSSNHLEDDSLVHLEEHSLEVELPMLQYFKANFQIVPIAFMSEELDILKQIGSDIGSVIRVSDYKGKVLLLASSDMTHYEPEEEARVKDNKAIEAILELDEDKLMRQIKNFNISMCGYAPVVVMLSAAKMLGAKSGRLAMYQTSGDITGDKTSVVGYAGVIIN
ncbi:MAG: AmmeMemoRadiSam system protein B [Candidatus Omnitrophica bacterium CG08_land_8_20_14_0_20_41_16]|uniref:MEMO1 family protein COX41_05870 n=1 Tax=Candidatus Sherwoodlollariibacterium unditelluris TaxID=1974757 RepID=A0A2G9YI59_9BACT|nr:MAG: AmmeMemoRadiSam system protein B [Candidatus Omnitrophica bacterium CG23_combo_of_CG06-09_8_20_14_all_41_10]PIS33592.1 MAG: AmmeMemoRadiSam system protein B [Candidatus Omnitrophica bacterium CG08_land_8_20_14_0_20_41_16]